MSAPLVLVHGSFGHGEDWREVVELLDRPAVTPDLQGHGERFGEAPRSFGDAVVDLGNSVPRDADLVGYSLGGRLALALAVMSSRPVRSLVLESAHPGLPPHEAAVRRRADLEKSIRLFQEPAAFLEEFYDAPLFASFREHPSFPLRRTERIARAERDPSALATTFRQLSTGCQDDYAGDLAASGIPTLFVAGERDDKYARIGRELADRADNVRLVLVPGAGHNVHLERPREFVAALGEFWESLS